MGKQTNIQWTHHTHNCWLGCRKVAPECEKCYIVRQTPLRVRHMKHGSERHRCSEATRNQPLAWDNAARDAGEKHLVFCLSLGDWLDDEVPVEWLSDLLRMVKWTRHLVWQLLTKRPQNFPKRILKVLEAARAGDDDDAVNWLWLESWFVDGVAPANVWIGVSAGADQRAALDIPAKLHFLSCEPMLYQLNTTHAAGFTWIIFGGESEPGGSPRSTDLLWIEDGIRFCREHNIKPFVKQLGGRPTLGGIPVRVSNAHGDKMDEWPEALRVREIPKL